MDQHLHNIGDVAKLYGNSIGGGELLYRLTARRDPVDSTFFKYH